MLREVTGRLTTRIRNTDQIYRFGDNVFLALLPEASLRGALLVAHRSQSSVAELLSLGDEWPESHVAVRVGVASFEGGAQDKARNWKNIVLRAEFSLRGPRGEPTLPIPV